MIVSVQVGCHGIWKFKSATNTYEVGLESSNPHPTIGDVELGRGESSSGGLGGLGRWPGGLDNPTSIFFKTKEFVNTFKE